MCLASEWEAVLLLLFLSATKRYLLMEWNGAIVLEEGDGQEAAWNPFPFMCLSNKALSDSQPTFSATEPKKIMPAHFPPQNVSSVGG